jgi:hypothetical protein
MGKNTSQPREEPTAARIVDIQMPFGSMVVFMVKWAIAAIPAIIILVALALLVSASFFSMIRDLVHTA